MDSIAVPPLPMLLRHLSHLAESPIIIYINGHAQQVVVVKDCELLPLLIHTKISRFNVFDYCLYFSRFLFIYSCLSLSMWII